MITSSYVQAPCRLCPFYVTAKRYQGDIPKDSGYTLILLHATGLHKETWEPVIESLLNSLPLSGREPALREIWAVDCPNHGESAPLNEHVLSRDYANEWDGYGYPRALYALIRASPGGINLLEHRLIIAGHSLGGNAAVLLTKLTPHVKLEAIILLDANIGPSYPERDQSDTILTQVLWSKPDVWRSREDALNSLSASPGCRSWDKRAVQLFVTHAVITHPASKYEPPYTFHGVTLACKKEYEASCYRARGHQEDALEQLHQLYTGSVPVHLILSAKDEFNAGGLKEAQLKAKYGRGPTSVQWIEDGTHMFVQQNPDATAKCIKNIVDGLTLPQYKL